MKRLEAICDAVANYHDYWNPESDAYSIRNPGLLLGDDGKRTFSCHKAGYAALQDRVRKYCEGHKEEKLDSLLQYLGIKMKLQKENAIEFMSRCVNSNALKLETSLDWFLHE